MPTDIRIIHAHDFIRATPEGRLDLEASRRLVQDIARASAPLVGYDIILDTRKAQSEMRVADLWPLAAELADVFRRGGLGLRKTAVLCPVERFDHAAFFALCSQNRGFGVNAFTSVADAYEWLIAAPT